jgi:cytoskeletal protein CcmA (bactofilin family)
MSKNSDYSINTIIGPNTNVTGNIESAGFARIDGSIRGNVKAQGKVVAGQRARLKGNVSGTAVTVGGVILGNIFASESIVVLSTALVVGDIITRRIQADDGCIINGKVSVCPDEESWVKAVSEHRDEQGVRSTLPVFHKANG